MTKRVIFLNLFRRHYFWRLKKKINLLQLSALFGNESRSLYALKSKYRNLHNGCNDNDDVVMSFGTSSPCKQRQWTDADIYAVRQQQWMRNCCYKRGKRDNDNRNMPIPLPWTSPRAVIPRWRLSGKGRNSR